MCVLSIKVPIRKKSGNLFNDPRILVEDIFQEVYLFEVEKMFNGGSDHFHRYSTV